MTEDRPTDAMTDKLMPCPNCNDPDCDFDCDGEYALSDDKLSGLVDQLRDNIITLWHDSKSEDRALHECLGMTWEEYQSWVSGKALSTTEGSDVRTWVPPAVDHRHPVRLYGKPKP